MKQILNFLHKYFLIFLGLLIILFFIWSRYLRTRYSKDIPLYLSIRGFIIISVICCIYLIVIKALIKPSKKSNIFSEYIVPLFYLPLEALDKFIKQYIDVEKIINKNYKTLTYMISETYIFYFIFAIFPRLLLITMLFIDTFYFHRLHYIYYFIYLTILLFLNRYIIYSLKMVEKSSMDYLALNLTHVTCDFNKNAATEEERNDPDFHVMETMCLSIDRFFNYITDEIVYNQHVLDYLSSGYTKKYNEEFCKRYYLSIKEQFTDYHREIRLKEENEIFIPKIRNTVGISCLVEEYNYAHKINSKFKCIKIVIFSIYFCCWFYILIKSVPNLNFMLLIDYLNITSRMLEEPFIGSREKIIKA